MPNSRLVLTKEIPSSGEHVPIIGMGTWDTFDVGASRTAREQLREVLRIFFEKGGRLIDSSPMYASSERVLGELLSEFDPPPQIFSATKVWTRGQRAGVHQMGKSREQWRIPRFDLMQIHNLLDWQQHIETLKEWKAAGRIRYIGITTSHGSRHAEMERIMLREPIDFVQLTYNLVDRSAEDRLLPLAQEKGIAVIANRPFDGGNLFKRLRGKSFPSWATEFGCTTWAQLFLKFVGSHPAITCAIPATRRPDHMSDYMDAMTGLIPDSPQRERIIASLS